MDHPEGRRLDVSGGGRRGAAQRMAQHNAPLTLRAAQETSTNAGDNGEPPMSRRRGWSKRRPLFCWRARGQQERPLTVSEAAASTTSFKDQSHAVDGPEPRRPSVPAPREASSSELPAGRPAGTRCGGKELTTVQKRKRCVTGGRALAFDTKRFRSVGLARHRNWIVFPSIFSNAYLIQNTWQFKTRASHSEKVLVLVIKLQENGQGY
jgi:hypothetical protein